MFRFHGYLFLAKNKLWSFPAILYNCTHCFCLKWFIEYWYWQWVCTAGEAMWMVLWSHFSTKLETNLSSLLTRSLRKVALDKCLQMKLDFKLIKQHKFVLVDYWIILSEFYLRYISVLTNVKCPKISKLSQSAVTLIQKAFHKFLHHSKFRLHPRRQDSEREFQYLRIKIS